MLVLNFHFGPAVILLGLSSAGLRVPVYLAAQNVPLLRPDSDSVRRDFHRGDLRVDCADLLFAGELKLQLVVAGVLKRRKSGVLRVLLLDLFLPHFENVRSAAGKVWLNRPFTFSATLVCSAC